MDVTDKLNMRPVFSVPLFGMESEAVALHRLCFSVDWPTHLLAGSLTGDIFQADLKKAEGGLTFLLLTHIVVSCTGSDHPEITESVILAHAGAVVVLERSPFFDDIFLSVGGWTFKVWKDGHSSPLFHSPCSAHKYTSGHAPPLVPLSIPVNDGGLYAGGWSPTRPGVFVVGTMAGAIELWDLCDQTSKPSLTAPIVSVPLTSVAFPPEFKNERAILIPLPISISDGSDGSDRRHGQQFLAVGDLEGLLHLMVIPRAFRRPMHQEKKTLSTIFHHQVLALQDRTAQEAYP